MSPAASGTRQNGRFWSGFPPATVANPLQMGGLLTGAVALGIYADLGHDLPGPLGLVPQLGGPWLLLAFVAGRVARRPLIGAVAGLASIAAGLLTYVAWKALAYGSAANAPLRRTAPEWAALAVVIGVGLGGAGAISKAARPWHRAAGWGVLAGGIATEAAAVLLTGRFAAGDAAVLAAAEAVAAAAIVGWALRRGVSPARLAAVLLATGAVGAVAVRLVRGRL